MQKVEGIAPVPAWRRSRDQTQLRILDVFTTRADADHFAKLVDNSEIAENSYNIAVSSYVEAEDTREVVGTSRR